MLQANRTNVGVFHGDKTLEYDLAFANHQCEKLVSDAMKHADEVRTLAKINAKLAGKLAKLFASDELCAMEAASPKKNMEQHRFAAAYLRCAEKRKGEHAFAIEQVLRLAANKSVITCPGYIQSAIEWVTTATPEKGATK